MVRRGLGASGRSHAINGLVGAWRETESHSRMIETFDKKINGENT